MRKIIHALVHNTPLHKKISSLVISKGDMYLCLAGAIFSTMLNLFANIAYYPHID